MANVLPAGTHPLPYVAVGMRVISHREPAPLRILEIENFDGELWSKFDDKTELECDLVRRDYTLAEDFDPEAQTEGE